MASVRNTERLAWTVIVRIVPLGTEHDSHGAGENHSPCFARAMSGAALTKQCRVIAEWGPCRRMPAFLA